eukprot:344913-Pelagomonas_calceolata.AAC.5
MHACTRALSGGGLAARNEARGLRQHDGCLRTFWSLPPGGHPHDSTEEVTCKVQQVTSCQRRMPVDRYMVWYHYGITLLAQAQAAASKTWIPRPCA